MKIDNAEKSGPIKVVLADDHPLIIVGFTRALAGFGIEVVGQASTPSEAVARYRAMQPDVLVLDIRFGEGKNGLDVGKEVLEEFPNAKIVYLSQFDQDSVIKEVYRLGGHAFITKGCDPALLAQAIKQANRGEIYFLPDVAERLARLAIRGDISPQATLDPREIEVFKLMATGFTNVEMAEKLGVSPKTISNVSQTVKEKLGVHRPAELTRLAVKHWMIEP